MSYNELKMNKFFATPGLSWSGLGGSVASKPDSIVSALKKLNKAFYVVKKGDQIGFVEEGEIEQGAKGEYECLGVMPPFLPEQLGNNDFCEAHNVKYAYHAGAMANGITSEELVIALGKEGFLASFGAGGFTLNKIEESILRIKGALQGASFAVNLLHNPANPEWEAGCVQLFLKHQVTTIEASAFLRLSPYIIWYRAAGLSRNSDGTVNCANKIIAKISRPEVARQFMEPAPKNILANLVKQGLISEDQAQLAQLVPVADDITIEGDSGGHTDNGVLNSIFPAILQVKNEIEAGKNYQTPIRLGVGGGIGTPEGALAAFTLGASYIVTGSVNQACVEAGTSDYVKGLLETIDISDVAMCIASDMFEMGAKVQVLKRGTFYPVRADKMYELYKNYNSIEEIPAKEMEILQKQYFKKDINLIWEDTVRFFQERDPKQIDNANKNPKKKMALIFQWYLGQSSRWAISGDEDRKMDYQIWCGAALGAFNGWVKGTYLEKKENRKVVDVAHNLMRGAAYLYRLQLLKGSGIFPPNMYQGIKPGTIGPEIYSSITYNYAIKGQSQSMNKGEFKPMTSQTITPAAAGAQSRRISLKKSKEYFDRLWQYIPGGTHYNFAEKDKPLVVPFRKGHGSRVWDFDGNEHIDLFCKFGALFVGHANQEYHQALIDYMSKVTSVDICDLEEEVGALMTKYIPCCEKVRFGLSGTESVQNAIRLGRAYTGKNRVIRFAGHYHGNSDNIMGGKLADDLSYPVPRMYEGDYMDTQGRFPNILQDQTFLLPWNNYEILEQTVERYKNEIGVIIMEAILINGGGIMPREGYLQKVRELCNRHNIVLIFDEVITGFRLGLSGAQGIVGVTPDIATFGKAMGGGSMPISAITGKKEIMELYRQGSVIHAGTFNGYPLGLAAVKATINIIEKDPGCYQRMGKHMIDIANHLIKASNDAGLPMVVQGMPTALVYHVQSEPIQQAEHYAESVKINDFIVREVVKRYGIQFSPVSRIYSNLMMNASDVQFFAERIPEAMQECKKIIDINMTDMYKSRLPGK